MITPDNYLDFGNIIFNEVFGDAILFTIIGMAIIAYFSIKYRTPVEVTVALLVVFGFLVIAYVYNALLLALIVLFIATLGYVLLSKVVKRT